MSIKLSSKGLSSQRSLAYATAAQPPIITGFEVSGAADDLALDIAGGQTVIVKGAGFLPGATVILGGNTIGSVTVVDPTTITFTSEARNSGTYNLFVVNSNGGAAILSPGISYSGLPTFVTSAGSLGDYYETQTISETIEATEANDTITYAVVSGSLPTGANLLSNGTIIGTAPVEANSTTYTFTVEAIDEENQSSTREFSLTINTDVVTWSSPADGTQYELEGGEAMANITLSANAASGSAITYTANALPNNVSLVNGVISGTPDLDETVQTQLTATADDTSRSATRNITFVVSLGDAYFNQTTLLLNADDNTFITDASDNAFTITPVADTRPSAFSPYNTNWSNYFDGTGDNLITGASNFSTSNFTLEFWLYPTSFASTTYPVYSTLNGAKTDQLAFELVTNGTLLVYISGTSVWNIVSGGNMGTITLNSWNHVALVREGNAFKSYINGTQGPLNTSSSLSIGTLNGFSVGSYVSAGFYTGYISNLRQVIGTAVYTENFTPPTEPLTAISGTSLLTCQSNRLIDNSTNNFTITKNGDVKVTSFGPFTETDTSTGSGYFDGTGDYLTVNNFNGSLGSGNYTIEFWFNTNDTNNFEFFAPTASLAGPAIIGSSTTTLSVQYAYGSATGFSWTTGNVFDNNWHHLALVRNGTTVTLYVDGISRASGTNSPATDYSGSTTNWTLGYGNQGAGRIYLGYMSNFRVVAGTAVYTGNFTPPSEPLTAIAGTQLLTLQNRISYNNSQPIDTSGIKNIVTRNGNASAGTFSPYVPTGWSGYFDGTGDYLAIDQGAVNLENWYSQDYTIEMWVYPTVHAQSGTNGSGLYLAHGVFNSNTVYWALGTSNTGHLRWYYFNGGAVTTTATTNPLSLNAWNHVALVYTHSTGAIKGYVNGVEVISATKAGTPQSSNTNDLNIGVSQNTYFTGYISNLRIKQGEAVYTSAFTPPTAPLEPVANTSLLTLRGPSFTDDGPNRFAITRNGDTKITPFSPFKTHTIVPDSHSVYFDGSGDYLLLDNVLAFGTNDWSWETWVYPTSFATTNTIVDFRPTNGAGGYFLLNIQTNGKFRVFVSSAARIDSDIAINLNEWAHVCVQNVSGVMTMYVNGVAQTTTWTHSTNFITAANRPIIGRFGFDGSGPFSGYMSDIRVLIGDYAYKSFPFTPPTAPLTAISGTSLLTCQSPTFIDNSTNDFAITVNGNSQPTKFNPFGETVTTGVEYSPVSHGGSVYFDGTGDYLSLPGATSFTLPSTMNWTVECWIYPDWTPSSDYRAIFSTQSASGTSSQLLWATYGTEPVYLSVLSGGGGVGSLNLAAPNNVIRMRQWQHIALVNNGGTLRQYHNGVPLGSGTAGNYTSPTTVTIGSAGTGSLFTGYIAGFNLLNGSAKYTSAFVPPVAPPTPIAGSTLLINGTNAAIQDKSGRNVLETVGDARVLNGVKKYGTGSMYFDGTGDYLNIPASSEYVFGTGDFTVECWIYPTTVSGSELPVFKLYGSVNSIVELRQVNNTMSMIFRSTSGSTSTLTSSAGTIVINTWHHLAFVRDNGTLRAFINGVQYTTATNTNTQTDTTLTIRVGTNQVPNAYFNGYIDDLRITKGVARYTANFTPPTSTHRLK